MKLTFKSINDTLLILGVVATISCVVWCIREYCLDLDLSQVDHKKFGDEKNYITPAFSLCFGNPFLKRNLDNYNLNITVQDYLNFLEGKHSDERMYQIDFENVTKKLDDYIVTYKLYPYDLKEDNIETFFDMNSFPPNLKKPYLSHTGFEFGQLHKCYSIDIPIKAQSVILTIKKQIFDGGIRPSFLGFSFVLHYPNQILQGFETFKNDWPTQKNKHNNAYTMLFKIKSLEVVLRRNTRKKPCNKNWRNDYLEILEESIKKKKCRAPYQIWNQEYPICDSKEKMANANFHIRDRDGYPPPCQHVEKTSYEFVEYDVEDLDPESSISKLYLSHMTMNDTFSICVGLMNSKFKLIAHKQAYDFQTLIGNCGGYIGLILGKSLFE